MNEMLENILDKFRNLNLNKLIIVLGVVAIIIIVIFILWWNNKIEIFNNNGDTGSDEPKNVSSIAGLECENQAQRPISVMMASDPEARPLSGIGQADMVFEMPVTPSPDQVTRMMAVFQCEKPAEIGSVRSARRDFVPLAAGLNSIYAHWGGEHGILDELNKKIIDNLDAIPNPGDAFIRKAGVKAPHNGFTSYDKLIKSSELLKYNLANNFSGYPHDSGKPKRNLSNLSDTIDIDYASPYNVRWTFNQDTNIYLRTRGGKAEIDKSTNQQVSSSVVIVMKTNSTFDYDQYVNVRVTGEGEAQIYQNGVVINGKWKKDAATLGSKLFFYDEGNKEIKFLPGKIWVEITTS